MVCDRNFKDNTLQESDVLILVLMEYGLRLYKSDFQKENTMVLILVLMEYGLRPIVPCMLMSFASLNPCFNGIWSATFFK